MSKFEIKKRGNGPEPEKGSPFRNWEKNSFKKLLEIVKKKKEIQEKELINENDKNI